MRTSSFIRCSPKMFDNLDDSCAYASSHLHTFVPSCLMDELVPICCTCDGCLIQAHCTIYRTEGQIWVKSSAKKLVMTRMLKVLPEPLSLP